MKRIAIFLVAIILLGFISLSGGSKIEVNVKSFTFRLMRFITFRYSDRELLCWTAHKWPVQNMREFSGKEDEASWVLYKKWRIGNNPGETPYEHDLYCFKGSVSEEIAELYDSGTTNQVVDYWLTEFGKRKANNRAIE